MNNNKKYALISVYDKKNLKKICETLTKYNIGLISTGSTRKEIKKNGFICDSVSNLTKLPISLGILPVSWFTLKSLEF